MRPKIAIIYLSYHCESYLDDVLSALKKLTYPKDRVEFIIVDNPHPEHGRSQAAIAEKVLPLSGKDLPPVTYLPQEKNLGFAGGNNAGIRWALARGFDYVYLHNDDGFMAPDALELLVEAMERDKQVAVAQSLLLLYPETEYLNNAGNSFHYLGFGFCDQYRVKRAAANLPKLKAIAYASGAACLARIDLIKMFGLLDEDFFMYHEDLEWCLRFRSVGYRTVLVSDSVFYHKYQFARSIQKYYYLERNRFALMLMYFRWPTLLLLAPMAAVLELGLIFFAWRRGWLDKRLAVYRYWLKRSNWKLWLKKRAQIHRQRKVSDRYLLRFSSPGVYFQEAAVAHPLLKYVGNPIMTIYYWLVVKGLVWW